MGNNFDENVVFGLDFEDLKNRFWKKYIIGSDTIYFRGYVYSHTIEKIIEIIKSLDKESIEYFVNSLDGNFVLIVLKNEFSFIAVDKIRSIPIFFAKIGNKFYVDCNPKEIVNKNNFNKSVIDSSILEISMSGYTVGNKTVYRYLHSLKAGEFVVFDNSSYKYIQYYKYFGNIEYKHYDDYIEELSIVTLSIFRKLLNDIGDRQIIIPLSAGNDSRLIASVLKHLGAKNVKCYSYGSIGNFEASVAEIVANKLGYEWVFIPLTHKSERRYYNSEEYKEYLKFSETYCSVPYIQGLSTIKYLENINFINEDAIFINGSTGDFISGNHISTLMKKNTTNTTREERKENILNNLINKHFSLWGHLKTNKNIALVKKSLWSEITAACKNLDSKDRDHLFYEYSELVDRQSSYVISGQRTYEFYNYEWRLPLWDEEYLYFWQKIPSEFKVNQKLYVDMLKKKNFGNVWSEDIPVNKKTITPKWIIPARFLFKIPFALFGVRGKKIWRQLEVSLFYYWMDVSHMVDEINYFSMIKSIFKKPRNHVSWKAKDYLKNLMQR